MNTRLLPLLLGLLLALGVTAAFAASSPALFTTRIDHQTVCRLESRDFPIGIGNLTDKPMDVRVDATYAVDDPNPGHEMVTFDESRFVMEPWETRVVIATLAIPKNQKRAEYATMLRFANVTPPYSAAVGVYLRFEVLPWRAGSKHCGGAL